MPKLNAHWQQYGLLVLIIAVSLSIYLYAVPCHLIATNDSLDYLSAAESFAHEGNFKSPDGSDYAHWPPLFPMLIAYLDHIQVSLKLFHGLLIGAIGLMLWNLGRHYFKKTLYRYFWLAAVLTNVQFLMISVFLWSELFFLFLLLVNLWTYLHRNQWKYWMFLFMFSGLLLCLQRSAGFFWMAGMGWILVLDKPKEIKNWMLSFVYCAVSVSGLLYWLMTRSKGNNTGFNVWEFDFFVDFGDNLIKIFKVSGAFFLPLGDYSGWLWILLAISIFLLRSYFKKSVTDLFWLIGFYTLGYSLMQNLDVGEIDRYYSVVYPFFFLLILYFMEATLETWAKKPKALFGVLFLIWMTYPLSRTLVNVERWHQRSCWVIK